MKHIINYLAAILETNLGCEVNLGEIEILAGTGAYQVDAYAQFHFRIKYPGHYDKHICLRNFF